MIKNRYKNCKMIIFRDFNLNKEEFKVKIKNVLGNDFRYHYNTQKLNFTRIRILYNNTIEKSYLDYFITYGFSNIKFDINLPIGKSTHLSLELYMPKNQIGQLIIQKKLIYPFNKTIKDSVFKNKNNVENIINMIKNLNVNYKPKV